MNKRIEDVISMKKFICVVLIVIMSLMGISCGTRSKTSKIIDVSKNSSDKDDNTTLKQKKGNSTTNNESKDTISGTENKNTTVAPQVNSKKQEYLKKLNGIQAGLKDLDSLYAGNNADMISAATEEYNRWNNALNEIYGVLKTQLSTIEMNQLQKEELQWIKDKEAKAKAAAAQWEGGSGAPLQYEASLAGSTKERCYLLVNNYMK